MSNTPALIAHCRAIVKAGKGAQFVWQTINGLDGLSRRRHTPVSLFQAKRALELWEGASPAFMAFLIYLCERPPHFLTMLQERQIAVAATARPRVAA